MIRTTLSAMALVAATTHIAQAQDPVTIDFAYPYASAFDVTFDAILPKFKEKYPHIEVQFRSAYEHYEDGTNTILRESVSDNLPDVTMQGLNRQAVLVEKGIAKSLQPFIDKEANFETLINSKPQLVIEKAVKGMMPRNPLGRDMLRKLKVYAGTEHPHTAQQPQQLEI